MADRFTNGPILPGRHIFPAVPSNDIQPDQLAYGGRWTVAGESATGGRGASLRLNFNAQRVFLVLGSPGGSRTMRVLLDGRPIGESATGSDVHAGVARVSNQRLYRLVDLPRAGRHLLTLSPEPGIVGYAFTFG